MLEEHEWAQIEPLLTRRLQQIKDYRAAHEAPLEEAIGAVQDTGALDLYYQLTGFRETDVDVLGHHRLSRFGPPCHACGKLLRTPRAKFCAGCGAMAPPQD